MNKRKNLEKLIELYYAVEEFLKHEDPVASMFAYAEMETKFKAVTESSNDSQG